MKKAWKATNLPVIIAALGGIALVLRRVLYATAVDARGLLPSHHPLTMALGVLSAVAVLYCILAVRKLDGSGEYADNFGASTAAAVGHGLASLGMLATVLLKEPLMPNYLGKAWYILGMAGWVCLFLAGLARMRGRQPHFLLHLIPCLFLVFHIVNQYQTWSGNPQSQDYGFVLFGSIALMFFAFYCAAFDAGIGRRRMQLFMGLMAVYLLLAELANTQYLWLYAGGIAWALTDLCSLTPVPKPEQKPEQKEEK